MTASGMPGPGKRKAHSPSVAPIPKVSGPFFRPAGGSGFFGVQTKLSVSRPGDPMEREADKTAEKVMRSPAGPVLGASTGELQRLGNGSPTVAANAHTEIKQASTGGVPLPREVRSFMEPRFGADFSQVRVHTNEQASSLSNHLSARAFTHGQHIFFGRDQFQPGTTEGRQLLAHELTHTIQQGASVQRAVKPDAAPVPVVGTATPTAVQRFGLSSPLDYFADKANFLPGFRMLTLVLGFNPINGRSADRTAANLLRALIELVPGGAVITQVLDNHGVINKAATWIEQQVATLGDIGGQIRVAISNFISSIKLTDIGDFGGLWERAKRIVTDPIRQLISFGSSVVGSLLSLVKEAILRPLAALAAQTPAYDLLKAVLGYDPVSGDPYPRTADTLIGGFMKLIGQEELWQNLKKGNAVARAFAWFEGALSGLLGFVTSIPQKVIQTLTSLTFADVITVVGAFRKIGTAFLDVVGQFMSWAGGQVLSLLEILVSVVAPGVMPYIAKAKAAFNTIIKDPVRFVGNLVRAGKLGFQQFSGRIVTHLKTALIKWITGPLGEAGVYIPTAFSLSEIVKLVLSVLGLTWQNIRSKLVKIIPDPILAGLEKTASVLTTLVRQGPAAAWEQIKGELNEMKDQLIGQVTSMISTEVVKAAVVKLVSMLNPAGAVIQAIIATYNTVMFFIERAQQIGAVVASFIDSIASIAAGNIAGAANRVEQTLANGLTVAISFLARFVGLGGIPGKVVGIVKKIRQPIDRGLDKIVGWLGNLLAKAVGKVKETAAGLVHDNSVEGKRKRLAVAMIAAERAVGRFAGRTVTGAVLRPMLSAIRVRYGLKELTAVPHGEFWAVQGVVNPGATLTTTAKTDPASQAGGITVEDVLRRIHPVSRGLAFISVGDPLGREGDESQLHPLSAYGLSGYIRYHIHGPGTGYEGFPILAAPTWANQFANHHIEGPMRRWCAAGVPVRFRANYSTFSSDEMRPFVEQMILKGDPQVIARLTKDQGRIEVFLKNIDYEIEVNRGGRKSKYHAHISIGPPPAGSAGATIGVQYR